MATTFLLRTWTRFFATPDEVWKIKTDPAALAAEFLPYMGFRMDPDALVHAFDGGAPASISARLRPFHVPYGISWPIELSAADPPVRFVDSSVNRLYSRFQHEHLFEPTPDGCRYVDAVTFTPRMLAKASAILTRRLFVHRHQVAARLLKADPQVTGVSVLRVLVEEEPDAG